MGFADVRGDLGSASVCGAPRLSRREFDLEGGSGGAILAMRSGVQSRWRDLGGAGVR